MIFKSRIILLTLLEDDIFNANIKHARETQIISSETILKINTQRKFICLFIEINLFTLLELLTILIYIGILNLPTQMYE